MQAETFFAKHLFDGAQMLSDVSFSIADGKLTRIFQGRSEQAQDLGSGLVAPGFVDLQVNGGAGVMFNDDPSPEIIAKIADAHVKQGSCFIVPTLITDHVDVTRKAIAAAIQANCAALHLEGPHLDARRKGAHDAGLIRPLSAEDLAAYLAAAKRLRLKLTVAPENVTPDQVHRLCSEGVVVSVGHSDATYEELAPLFAAGASCVTHLYNAMSASVGRAPGLVGATYDHDAVFAGIIADGIHVHPANLRLAQKNKPGKLYLVSDAMATIGAPDCSFRLNGRLVSRKGDRLTLEDGTLAGAHLHMAQAVRLMIKHTGVAPEAALAMATRIPAEALRLKDIGRIAPGARADFLLLDPSLNVCRIWKEGVEIDPCRD